MTDRDAFLQAIIADPDDDNPRLIFADWLEEQGDGERAETLRAGRMPVGELDEQAIVHLACCRFAPATSAKRFARQMQSDLQAASGVCRLTLTVKQWCFLWKLAHQYRRQITSSRVNKLAARLHEITKARSSS